MAAILRDNMIKNKLNIILPILLLIFFVLNIDSLVININFAYYFAFLGLMLFVAGKINLLIFLFLIFYQLQYMIPLAQNQLFNFINIDDILLLYIAMLLFLSKTKNSVSYKKLDRNSKAAIHFTLFMLVVVLSSYLRSILISGISEKGYFHLMKIIVKAVLLTLVIIIIILKSKNKSTQKIIDNGIYIVVILLAMTCVFWKMFQNIGINASLRISEYQATTIERTGSAGLDLNQFAALMLLGFGYFLSRIEVTYRKRHKYYVGCIFSMIGIFSSGSRFGLIILIIISSVFFIRNIKKIKHLIPLIILMSVILILSDIPALERMKTVGRHLDAHEGSGRLRRQIIAINYLLNNPSNLLIGSRRSFYDVLGTTRHLHNEYLSILYRYGIILFSIYIILIFKLFRLEKFRRRDSYSLIYPLLAFFLPKLAVVYGLFIYFPLIVAMASNDLISKSKTKEDPIAKRG